MVYGAYMSDLFEIYNHDISIVIHGGCFSRNYADIANILLSYKKIFDGAEIIFSISSSDFIDFDESSETHVSSHKKEMSNFCYLVNQCADKIAYARMGHPLPPVFANGNLCNVNNLIEAAHNGLALATRKFVLRVRNDLLFKDRTFIETYKKLYHGYYRKGKRTVFDLPVMIASLYTLNSFAGTRLAFHYGDWFHFGLLSDVRPIWDIPLVTLDFMTHYRSHYAVAGSQEKERNFLSRLAVEQYIHYGFFRKKFKDIVLNCHNDGHSLDISMDILLDNFIVCDLYDLNVYFQKYNDGFEPYFDRNKRVTQESWMYLSTHPRIKPSDFLSFPKDRIGMYTPKLFPLKMGSEYFYTEIGIRFGKSIVVPHDAEPGIVCFGPYISLLKGTYCASVKFSALYPQEEFGKLSISAKYDKAKKLLACEEYEFPKTKGMYNYNEYILDIEFCVEKDIVDNFEVVVEIFNRMDMSVDFVEINKI